ncbi:hypothetical protein ACM0CO_19600 [Mycobacteroides abscessus subsp. abscessus]|uniref:hypothetical protein n=1 Tax=Mycobacteroides abscessus TaxID=36809 RepID=UPI0039EE2FA8
MTGQADESRPETVAGGPQTPATNSAPDSATTPEPPPFYVPATDDRLLGDVLVGFAHRFTWGTRVFFRWVVVIIGIGVGLYIWVAARSNASTAFDVTTQHLSPMGSNLGVAGVLLGIYGYFLAPAMVGAVVGGVYTATAAMSGKRVRNTATDIATKAQHGPGKIHRALNKVKLGRRS